MINKLTKILSSFFTSKKINPNIRIYSGQVPTNIEESSFVNRNLDEDVRYAFNVASGYANKIIQFENTLESKVILEIGPGLNLGTALLLRAWGAGEVHAIDKYTHAWVDEYHNHFYEKLINFAVSSSEFKILNDQLNPINSFTDLEALNINYKEYSLEDFNNYSEYFDITLSNATLEHVEFLVQSMNNLYKITSSQGIGIHQVDFRDHRDFEKPLEYLLMDEMTFAREFNVRNGEIGNRFRPDELTYVLKNVGFSQFTLEPNLYVEKNYLNSFVLRLKNNKLSKYSHYEAENLEIASGLLILRK